MVLSENGELESPGRGLEWEREEEGLPFLFAGLWGVCVYIVIMNCNLKTSSTSETREL